MRQATKRVTALEARQPRVAVDSRSQITVIQTGTTYDVYDDSVLTYGALPAQTYRVSFTKDKGFFLVKVNNPQVNERTYGVHDAKAEKVVTRFLDAERNLGVILSGKKGLGKSVTGKLICLKLLALGYPVIVVDNYVPGISAFLESIRQKCVVFFDEYDKVFKYDCHNDYDPSTEMLTLFDGVMGGDKLFVVTCNNVMELNEYLVNRPGRFHFHLRFDYPTPEEVREYLEDQVDPEFEDQVNAVVEFSRRANLNYDCLRAIVTELNYGELFADAIADLNILNVDDQHVIIQAFILGDNEPLTTAEHVNLCQTTPYRVAFYDEKDAFCGYVTFTPSEADPTDKEGVYVLGGDRVSFFDDGGTKLELSQLVISRVKENEHLRYSL